MKRTKAQRVLAVAVRSRSGCAARGAPGWAHRRSGGGGLDLLHGLHTRRPSVTNTPSIAPADGGDDGGCDELRHPPSTSSGLAFTGADIEEMAVIGVVAIGVGAVLVRGRRRTA